MAAFIVAKRMIGGLLQAFRDLGVPAGILMIFFPSLTELVMCFDKLLKHPMRLCALLSRVPVELALLVLLVGEAAVAGETIAASARSGKIASFFTRLKKRLTGKGGRPRGDLPDTPTTVKPKPSQTPDTPDGPPRTTKPETPDEAPKSPRTRDADAEPSTARDTPDSSLEPAVAPHPIESGEITTYKDFVSRSQVGDKLEGHEIWQHANLKAHGLANERLSTAASQNNPVIALDQAVHKKVNAAQSALNAAEQTPLENIKANADILRNVQAAPERTITQLEEMAIKHAQSLGY